MAGTSSGRSLTKLASAAMSIFSPKQSKSPLDSQSKKKGGKFNMFGGFLSNKKSSKLNQGKDKDKEQ